MTENDKNQEQDYYENLVRDRMVRKDNVGKFAKDAARDSYERSKAPIQKGQEFREQREQMKNAYGMSKKGVPGSKFVSQGLGDLNKLKKAPTAVATAFTEIDPAKDWVYWTVLMFSILADILTVIPVIGCVFAIIFSLLIVMLYAVGGHYRINPAKKAVILLVAAMIEMFLPILNALPFFTGSAIINYWYALADRKMQKEESNS